MPLRPFCFQNVLFLPLSLQNDPNMLFVFHYDQNLTACDVCTDIKRRAAANIQTAAKPQKLKTFTQTKVSLRINKVVD